MKMEFAINSLERVALHDLGVNVGGFCDTVPVFTR